MTDTSNWFSETLYEDWRVTYRLKNHLHEEKTPFQNMRFVETVSFGKMLVLDGAVQTTEADEFIYHEMMSHVPLFTHPNPRTVLVIGGGDGGILREVLKHPSVEKATLVEIDRRVIDFSIEHLPMICESSFADERVEVVVDDGAAFLQKTGEKYDVIIVDSPDPIGPATVLFSLRFYQDIDKALAPGGIMVRQSGAPFVQREEFRESCRLLHDVYAHVAPYLFSVPTYVGGSFSSVMVSQEIDPLQLSEPEIKKRCGDLGLSLRYYNPGVHVAAFKLPEYLKETLTWQKR